MPTGGVSKDWLHWMLLVLPTLGLLLVVCPLTSAAEEGTGSRHARSLMETTPFNVSHHDNNAPSHPPPPSIPPLPPPSPGEQPPPSPSPSQPPPPSPSQPPPPPPSPWSKIGEQKPFPISGQLYLQGAVDSNYTILLNQSTLVALEPGTPGTLYLQQPLFQDNTIRPSANTTLFPANEALFLIGNLPVISCFFATSSNETFAVTMALLTNDTLAYDQAGRYASGSIQVTGSLSLSSTATSTSIPPPFAPLLSPSPSISPPAPPPSQSTSTNLLLTGSLLVNGSLDSNRKVSAVVVNYSRETVDLDGTPLYGETLNFERLLGSPLKLSLIQKSDAGNGSFTYTLYGTLPANGTLLLPETVVSDRKTVASGTFIINGTLVTYGDVLISAKIAPFSTSLVMTGSLSLSLSPVSDLPVPSGKETSSMAVILVSVFGSVLVALAVAGLAYYWIASRGGRTRGFVANIPVSASEPGQHTSWSLVSRALLGTRGFAVTKYSCTRILQPYQSLHPIPGLGPQPEARLVGVTVYTRDKSWFGTFSEEAVKMQPDLFGKFEMEVLLPWDAEASVASLTAHGSDFVVLLVGSDVGSTSYFDPDLYKANHSVLQALLKKEEVDGVARFCVVIFPLMPESLANWIHNGERIVSSSSWPESIRDRTYLFHKTADRHNR